MNPCGDDGCFLLHAMRIGGDGLRQIIRQLKAIGIVVNPLLSVLHADAEDICNEIQELNAGRVFIQIGIIRNIRQLLYMPAGLSASTRRRRDFSLVKLLDADHGFERCGLSAPCPIKPRSPPGAQAEVVHDFFPHSSWLNVLF